MNFHDLLNGAPVRTHEACFRDLFHVELLLTPADETKLALEKATRKRLDRETNQWSRELDQDRLNDFLAGRVVGLRGLTLRKAMTLCGRTVPLEVEKQADQELDAEPETVLTLLRKVVGFAAWLLGELRTSAQDAARMEEQATKN